MDKIILVSKYIKIIPLLFYFPFFAMQLQAQPDKENNHPIITLEYPLLMHSGEKLIHNSYFDQPVIEIRTYTITEGKRAEFHQLVTENVTPLLKELDTRLFFFGPSLHDENSFYLVRAYNSLAEREQNQKIFYESIEWHDGPREKILSLIENYNTVVLNMDMDIINDMIAYPH